MSMIRAMAMLEHSGRQEQRFIDIVKIYQEALAVIAANKCTVNSTLIAQEALTNTMPIYQAMMDDKFPAG